MQEGEASTQNNQAHTLHRGVFYQRIFQGLVGLFLCVVLINSVTGTTSAHLEQRSVAVDSSLPSVTTGHTFTFDILGTPTIGSVTFEYCSNSPLSDLPCVVPTGLSTAAATLSTQLGIADFSVHPDTALSQNKIIITRTPGIVAAGTVKYSFSGIVNPDSSNDTVFVRMSTYSSTDGTGTYDDNGSVSFSVQNPLTVTLYVPPYLALCTGVTVAADCTSTSGTTVDLGELSKTQPTTATTQFAVATNSINGYVTSIQGSTMTAGNQVIASLPVQTSSQIGTGQFGINLRANSSPSVGQDVSGSGTGTVSANYNTPNNFRFGDGDTLATSSLPTEWNRYTISYLVNIGSSQQAGRYAATMTVIATTTF